MRLVISLIIEVEFSDNHSILPLSLFFITVCWKGKNESHYEKKKVAQWLGRRISDEGVLGSNPGRCTFRCGLEQVTFTLLSTG